MSFAGGGDGIRSWLLLAGFVLVCAASTAWAREIDRSGYSAAVAAAGSGLGGPAGSQSPSERT